MSLPCVFCTIHLININFNGQQTCFAGNHKNIFNDARVPWSEYRYYDPKTVGLDFEGMISDIKVRSGVVMLHSKIPTKLFWIIRIDAQAKHTMLLNLSAPLLCYSLQFVLVYYPTCHTHTPSLPLGLVSVQAHDWTLHYWCLVWQFREREVVFHYNLGFRLNHFSNSCYFFITGSPWGIICVATWLCSQPNWYWSNPWTMGENCWCHSRKEPYSIFWCCLPGKQWFKSDLNNICTINFFSCWTKDGASVNCRIFIVVCCWKFLKNLEYCLGNDI